MALDNFIPENAVKLCNKCRLRKNYTAPDMPPGIQLLFVSYLPASHFFCSFRTNGHLSAPNGEMGRPML